MNSNHQALLEHLIPLVWNPGHMGAFLGRFLIDDARPSSLDKDHYQIANFEWSWYDRVHVYMEVDRAANQPHRHDFEQAINILSKYYQGNDLHAACMYVAAQHTFEKFTSRSIFNDVQSLSFNGIYTDEEIINMANRSFDFNYDDDFYFPYLKSHIYANINLINQLPWRKKVICRFPKDKKWMPELLFFYKKFYHWTLSLEYYLPKTFFSDIENFIGLETGNFKEHFYHSGSEDQLKDFIIIDIYDLIFNKNSQQLIQLEDKFENPLSESRLNLLKKAKAHITHICSNIFGVDVNANFGDSILDPKNNPKIKAAVDLLLRSKPLHFSKK